MNSFAAIVSHVPVWVGFVFLALLLYGLSQTRPRRMKLRRTVIMPVVMGGLSLYGVSSAFPGHLPALLGWAAAFVAVVALRMLATAGKAPAGVRYLPQGAVFELPGSWAPLALMMLIFVLKFGVGMSLGMHPALGSNTVFACIVSALYGAFAGAFATRSMRLWRLVRQETQRHSDASGASRLGQFAQ